MMLLRMIPIETKGEKVKANPKGQKDTTKWDLTDFFATLIL